MNNQFILLLYYPLIASVFFAFVEPIRDYKDRFENRIFSSKVSYLQYEYKLIETIKI